MSDWSINQRYSETPWAEIHMEDRSLMLSEALDQAKEEIRKLDSPPDGILICWLRHDHAGGVLQVHDVWVGPITGRLLTSLSAAHAALIEWPLAKLPFPNALLMAFRTVKGLAEPVMEWTHHWLDHEVKNEECEDFRGR